MTRQQRTALANPTLFAFQCANPRYALDIPNRELRIVLTVNAGYE